MARRRKFDRPWEAAEVELAKALRLDGRSGGQIGAALGRTRNAVGGMFARLAAAADQGIENTALRQSRLALKARTSSILTAIPTPEEIASRFLDSRMAA
jgi:hypothetical protein